jgi:hypothetical protein
MNMTSWRTFFCLALSGLLVACDYTSQSRSPPAKYANRSEVVRSELIAKGWIPEFLPNTATNIVEWHNVETDRSRVEFSFDSISDNEWIHTYFSYIFDSRTNTLKHDVLLSKGASISLHGDLQYYELTKPSGEVGYMLVNLSERRAQYWSKPAR